MGDEPNASYDGGPAIHHVGAHNVYRTLQWIFRNFPNPSQIFLTGCSAGGTPQPVIYDIINAHYNESAVKIDVVMDSPVFLTPTYFLRNYMPSWNVGTILNEIGFDFDTYMHEESFPDQILDYTLQRAKETDNFGFVTHDEDQLSIFYFTTMSGSLFGGRDRELSSMDPSFDKFDRSEAPNFGRRMVGDIRSQWWGKINDSLTRAMDTHSNMNSFIVEGNGHCSFGLNVPLQYTGFEEWVSGLVNETEHPDMPSSSPMVLLENSTLSPTVSPDIIQNVTLANMAARRPFPSIAAAAVLLLALRFLPARVY